MMRSYKGGEGLPGKQLRGEHSPFGVHTGCPADEFGGSPTTGATRQEARSSTNSAGGALPVLSSPQSSFFRALKTLTKLSLEEGSCGVYTGDRWIKCKPMPLQADTNMNGKQKTTSV